MVGQENQHPQAQNLQRRHRPAADARARCRTIRAGHCHSHQPRRLEYVFLEEMLAGEQGGVRKLRHVVSSDRDTVVVQVWEGRAERHEPRQEQSIPGT